VSISIVVLTHNRLHLLRQCVENVLLRTSDEADEIVIWDNASSDGTSDYLDALDDPRIRVVHHGRNIGQNAYALAFAEAGGEYLVELDDDIIDAPLNWDARLREAFDRLPHIGFLAANLANNPHDSTAQIMYGENASLYRYEEVNGVKLKLGPTGGGCAITSRELYTRVGGFKQEAKRVFWLEDARFIEDLRAAGYEAAYVDDLQVVHAGGQYYAALTADKKRYWDEYFARLRRRNAAKRALLRVPFVRPLNERFGWFVPPDPPSATA
jgi:GT2 family glycosyltransferase